MLIRETRKNLLLMAVAVAVGAGSALGIAASTSDPDLKKGLQTALLSLIFVALLGGFVKLLLDEVDRGRQERAEQAQFLLTTLNDLKAVYDHTERARLLIPAHQSALTYGQEMRGLIDAKVRLLTIERALKFAGASPSSATILKHVHSMTTYLDGLVEEYRKHYKPISERQREYEAAIKGYLATREADPIRSRTPPPNDPWEMIGALPGMGHFLSLTDPAGAESLYGSAFLNPLDAASQLLTADLDVTLGRSRPRRAVV